VDKKKEEGFLPPVYEHDIVPQPPANAHSTSTSHATDRGDALDPPQNSNMWIFDANPTDSPCYVIITHPVVFSSGAATTSLLFLISSILLLKFVASVITWVLNLI
ncbi:hypothetical protein U0070_027049, partial [Myodes glareolus]